MSFYADNDGVLLLVCSLQRGEESRRIAIQAASTPCLASVRITGSCASFDPQSMADMHTDITKAFRGCSLTILGGGTRMVHRVTGEVLPGITETMPDLHRQNPRARIIGVAPRQTDLRLVRGMVVIADDKHNPYITIVHPGLKTCLLLQYSADQGLPGWTSEWKTSLDLLQALRDEGGHRTLHLIYGGGRTTEQELLHVLGLPHNPANPWRVLLVANVAGISGQYANDRSFCDHYANRVVVCNAHEIRDALGHLDFIDTA